MRTEARILNAIPSNLDLDAYFDTLDIFDKRELLNELEVCKSIYSKNLKRNINLVIFAHVISIFCYFGVQKEWFMYYLLLINIPMDIYVFLLVRNVQTYQKAINHLENRLGDF